MRAADGAVIECWQPPRGRQTFTLQVTYEVKAEVTILAHGWGPRPLIQMRPRLGYEFRATQEETELPLWDPKILDADE